MTLTIKQIAHKIVKHARVGLTQMRPFEESQTYAESMIVSHLPPNWVEFYRNCCEIRDTDAQLKAANEEADRCQREMAALRESNKLLMARIRELETELWKERQGEDA